MKLKSLTNKLSKIASCLALGVAISSTAEAEVGCVNANVMSGKLVTDICWACVFPIRVGGLTISGSTFKDRIPDGASKTPACICWDNLGVPRPGIPTSFWQPNRLVEYQRVSGCSSVFNGTRFPFNRLNQGTQNKAQDRPAIDATYRHYHYYAFPIMIMLDMYIPGHCNPGAYHDLDVLFLSELDPTWSNDELAFFTNPEAALLGTPPAVVACIPDAVAANIKAPLKELYWCAGSWGTIYPFSGHVLGRDGILKTTSAMTVRTLAALHRRGMEWSTVGEEGLCGGTTAPRLPKNQYRFSLFHPTPEATDNHALGESELLWGMSRTMPSVGEDPVYVIWRWLDCCNT